MSLPLETLGVHHVAFVVDDLDTAIAHWETTYGAQVELRKELPDQRVEAAALAIGDSEVELIRPTDDDSGVARFLAKNGPGLHHIAYGVRNVGVALDTLAAAGFELIDRTPRIGLHEVPIAFLHPRSTFGTLTELVEVRG